MIRELQTKVAELEARLAKVEKPAPDHKTTLGLPPRPNKAA
jgi:BMFP domain-containing protein YqiC